MIVTILRHGKAGTAPTDFQRTLTDRGIDDITNAGTKFSESLENKNLPHPGLILYSEWVRTTQTAQIISRYFPSARLEPDNSLVIGATLAQVDQSLVAIAGERKPEQHVMLVSHQPLVSELADYYLGFPNTVPGLSPGSLVSMRLEYPGANCASLLFWSAPPNYEIEQ